MKTPVTKQVLTDRVAAIIFDGEFFQAEPLQYPFDAECFGTRADAEKWLRSEFDRLSAA